MSEKQNQTESILPTGSAPAPIDAPHFPDRVHAFVFRNWQAVEPARIAKVLGTSVANVQAIADSMGLPAPQPFVPRDAKRGYITVLRRNWHLLPYEQVLELLDMSAEELAVCLREDDFLWIKLGSLKPACEPLHYREADDEARRGAARIKQIVQHHFAEAIKEPMEPRFGFIRRLSEVVPRRAAASRPGRPFFELRFIYSYFAMFGDPLMTPQLDPFPDGLLQNLAAVGADGVWLHVVLREMAPGGDAFPEFGEGHEKRLAALRYLVSRAAQHGIKVYLYMNEPRTMPAAFFEKRPQMAGVPAGGDLVRMCTSDPTVKHWIADALTHVFRAVPGLGGVFTITASENPTHCASHRQHEKCPRCGRFSDDQIIAELNNTIEAGVHRGDPNAKVIAWDWGWKGHGDAPETIKLLNKNIWFMSASEWCLPIERGGVQSQIGEYSMSAVGPGPRASRHWSIAREAGLKTVAKVQLNVTWECASVPYLPVMNLVAQHCHRLANAGVNGLMLSWSLGGFPSPNLQIADRFSGEPIPSVNEVLDTVAAERFGAEGAPHARRAWTRFSDAFGQYPYHIGVLYTSPVQVGPMNLLHEKATHYRATMLGYPYDDLDNWRGPYPPDVFSSQFEKLVDGWSKGIEHLERACGAAPADRADDAAAELRYARAAWLSFRSIANQTRFITARNQLSDAPDELGPDEQQRLRRDMKRILNDEIDLAKQLHGLAQEDSCIGFEASNHYLYLPVDLIEKVISCEHLLGGLA